MLRRIMFLLFKNRSEQNILFKCQKRLKPTGEVQRMGLRRTICLIFIIIFSAGGLYTAIHLNELHYKKPKHQLNLINKFKFAERWFPRKEVLKAIQEEKYKDNPYLNPDFNPYKNMLNPTPEKKKKETCDINETWSCSDVDDSPFSESFGIGNGLLGIVGYSLMILLSLIHFLRRKKKSDFFSLSIYIGACIGLGFTIYLTCIEEFVLKKFCPWCVASAVCMTLIFLLTLFGFGAEPVVAFFKRELFPTSLLKKK